MRGVTWKRESPRAVVQAPVQFGRPDGQIIGRVEVGVIPAQFLLALFTRQARPGGLFFAQSAGEMFVVIFGILRLVVHGSISSKGGFTWAVFSGVESAHVTARRRPRS